MHAHTIFSEDLLAPEPLKLKIAEKRTKNIPLWQNNRKEYNLYQVLSKCFFKLHFYFVYPKAQVF